MLILLIVSATLAIDHVDVSIAQEIDSNEIIPGFVRRKQELPRCVENSICGFLQANDKGLTKLQYCECGGGEECPLQWDQFDGQSVSQAQADQYKYCRAAPAVSECSSPEQVAYTSVATYHDIKQVSLRDEIHCTCPFGSSYLDYKFETEMDGLFEILKTTYYCMPLPVCNATSTCKVITEKPEKYIVDVKCLCPTGQVCPSVSPQHSETIRFGQSLVHQVQCERPRNWNLTPSPRHSPQSPHSAAAAMYPNLVKLLNQLATQEEQDAIMNMDMGRKEKRSRGGPKAVRLLPAWRRISWGPAVGPYG